MSNIIKFASNENELYLFEIEGKTATISTELMEFEGYKDPRSAWRDVKKKEDFEQRYEYITLKDEELRYFKENILKNHDLSEVVGKTTTTLYEKYKSVPSLDIVLEEGIYGVMNYSNSGHAKQFKKFLRREVNPELNKKGRYDLKEQEIMNIRDETEKRLNFKIKKYEEMLEMDHSDLFIINQLNSCKMELNQYQNTKNIEEVKNQVKEINQKLLKTTVLREGDMSAETIARKFNVFSYTHRPHIRLAENLAKDLGIYKTPKGAAGYQDEYISINLTEKGGKTVSEIKYSQVAFRKMQEYVDENGLNITEPRYFSKGKNKGKFDHAYILFMDDRKIKINESTYYLYSKLN
ncbi:hypothetical protein KQI37_06175 [Bacillus halotolerans]|uniref:hypothetical protein n=1 Tax=Bacillus halotolerans TaxID=260554 RepID=UPI001C0F395D|nr:hypothetical protein [Bacillus halotolerans]MBU5245284.1 hypothetical protein [Bacillus halotolerans]